MNLNISANLQDANLQDANLQDVNLQESVKAALNDSVNARYVACSTHVPVAQKDRAFAS